MQTPEFWATFEHMENGCWRWLGSLNDNYGTVYHTPTKRNWSTHRLAYFLTHGDIPRGQVVRHTCDFPPCGNPQHLLLGTHMDNYRDRVERGPGPLTLIAPVNPYHRTPNPAIYGRQSIHQTDYEADEPERSDQCEMVTKQGTRCLNVREPGKNVCMIHFAWLNVSKPVPTFSAAELAAFEKAYR